MQQRGFEDTVSNLCDAFPPRQEQSLSSRPLPGNNFQLSRVATIATPSPLINNNKNNNHCAISSSTSSNNNNIRNSSDNNNNNNNNNIRNSSDNNNNNNNNNNIRNNSSDYNNNNNNNIRNSSDNDGYKTLLEPIEPILTQYLKSEIDTKSSLHDVKEFVKKNNLTL